MSIESAANTNHAHKKRKKSNTTTTLSVFVFAFGLVFVFVFVFVESKRTAVYSSPIIERVVVISKGPRTNTHVLWRL